ncbi:hypothetical protein Hanom_Chr05g00442981 [Helianthus anomalus]
MMKEHGIRHDLSSAVLKFQGVNCHFGPYGLGTFAILVQISNFLNLGPCGFTFITILVQNSKTLLFYCCNLPILSFCAGVFLSNIIFFPPNNPNPRVHDTNLTKSSLQTFASC